MKTHLILSKQFFSTASRLSLNKTTALLVLILCFGISPAWGAKPGAIFYVNASAAADGDGTSWNMAFNNLQDALDAAVSGDQIWAAAGTYTPSKSIDDSSDPRTAAFILKSGVKIYGSFAGDEKQLEKRQLDPRLTVLSGDIGLSGDDTDNSYHVVYANAVTDAVLDGFTVTGGRGDVAGRDSKGAGMYNYNSALTVSNCTFSDNRVAVRTNSINGYGAGMYNYNSAPIVSNCIFSNNQAGKTSISSIGGGGGMYNQGFFGTPGVEERWPLVTGCTFSDNIASSRYEPQFGGGGGMYNYDSALTVDRCTFVGNLGGYGGGMLNFYGMPTITNCIFNTNSTSYPDGFGGAIYNLASSSILNCTFYQNGWRLMPENYPAPRFRPYTAIGGAIFDERSGSRFIANCIFSENAVRAVGGAIASSTGRFPITLTNNLFYENIHWQPGYDAPEISHVYRPFVDVNNLYDIDPLLVAPAGGDFHLRYDSPCIDAGYALTRGYLPAPWPEGLPTTDFEGDKRIVDGYGGGGGAGDSATAIDIGVDEFIPNLHDLQAFLEALTDSGELDEATAARLIAYIEAAQAESDREAVTTILNELIADVEASLGGTETGQVIVQKTKVVIENLN